MNSTVCKIVHKNSTGAACGCFPVVNVGLQLRVDTHTVDYIHFLTFNHMQSTTNSQFNPEVDT